MSPAGFEPAIPVSERPKTLVLDSVAAGIAFYSVLFWFSISSSYPVADFEP
jgi:hypothetical protein